MTTYLITRPFHYNSKTKQILGAIPMSEVDRLAHNKKESKSVRKFWRWEEKRPVSDTKLKPVVREKGIPIIYKYDHHLLRVCKLRRK